MGDTFGKDGAASLSVAGVSKFFGQTRALADIDLEVASGEFVSLLGPSGCGKTTLLRCVAGLIAVDGGEIAIDGNPINDVPPWKRDISVVFQSYALFPHMSVADNVAFGLRMRGMAKGDIASRVDETLGLVQMTQFRDRLPGQLSGGQQQRVALARAIVVRPRVLLLDEPLAALDAKLRASVQREIRQLQTKLGITTVLVTHDQSEAMSMSDRIAVMNVGRIEQFSDPLTLYREPVTPFVAEFVGEINRIHGFLERSDGQLRLRPEGAVDMTIPVDPSLCSGDDGDKVTLMLRPESVRVESIRNSSGADEAIQARLEDIVLVGDRITLYARCEGLVLRSVMLNQHEADREPMKIGEPVALKWNVPEAKIFDGHV